MSDEFKVHGGAPHPTRARAGCRTDSRDAIVVLTKADGRPLPVGSAGELAGGKSSVVGYDGRAFVEDLANGRNEVTVSLPEGVCRASFDYAPRDD